MFCRGWFCATQKKKWSRGSWNRDIQKILAEKVKRLNLKNSYLGDEEWQRGAIGYNVSFTQVSGYYFVQTYQLYMDKEVERVFPVAPISSFKSVWKLSSYLVRAKLIRYRGQWDQLNVINPDVKYTQTLLRLTHLQVQQLEKALKSIINLTVMANGWHISSHM